LTAIFTVHALLYQSGYLGVVLRGVPTQQTRSRLAMTRAASQPAAHPALGECPADTSNDPE